MNQLQTKCFILIKKELAALGPVLWIAKSADLLQASFLFGIISSCACIIFKRFVWILILNLNFELKNVL